MALKDISDDIQRKEVLDNLFPIPFMIPGEPRRKSYGYGIIKDGEYLIENIIYRSMDWPAEAERNLMVPTDSCEEISFDIFENDSDDQYVTPSVNQFGEMQYTDPALGVIRIARINVKLPEGIKKGWPIRIRFCRDNNGFTVEVIDAVSGETISRIDLS